VYRTTSKDLVRDVPSGTRYVQLAGGGGGYGPPEQRSAQKVRQEVEDGVISLTAAREIYRVVIDPQTLELDLEATARLRAERGSLPEVRSEAPEV